MGHLEGVCPSIMEMVFWLPYVLILWCVMDSEGRERAIGQGPPGKE